jgi:hypothetical protein
MRFGPALRFETPGGGGGGTPPTTPPSAPPPPEPSPPDTTGAIPRDRFNEVTRQAREAAAERDRLKAELQQREDADKSEKERAEAQAAREKKRADDAEANLAKTRRNHALHAAATRAGAVSPDAIVALAESRGVEIDPDKPDTIDRAIAAMKGTDETPGPDAALFGGDATPSRPAPLAQPHTPPPSSGNGNESDDPKEAIGRGLFAHITGAGR